MTLYHETCLFIRQTVAPKIDRRSLRNINVREGESFIIDVKVIGEPAPDVTWTVGNKSVPLNHSRRIDDVPYNSKYTNDKAERKDTAVYTVTAVNKYGQDTAEIEVVVVSKPSKPEGPLEVSDVHKDGCKLKWKKPKDDGGSPVEMYVVEKYDADSGMWLPVEKTASPECEVTGLVPGHEYQFRVKAVNKEGESEPLETLAPIVAKDPFTVPSAPRSPEAVDWSQSHFELTWKEPASDGGAPITGYIVEKRDKYSGLMWEKAAETSGADCHAKVMNLIENLEYQFRIVAVNKAGLSEPSDATKPMIAKARFRNLPICQFANLPMPIPISISIHYVHIVDITSLNSSISH